MSILIAILLFIMALPVIVTLVLLAIVVVLDFIDAAKEDR